MLRKIRGNYDSCDATQGEPLFLRVSPGGVSAISLTSYLRNGIHPQMAVSPAPLGLFMRAVAARVRRFICDNVIDMFFSDKFISDNLQDEYAIDKYAIDIYQRNPGRGYASTQTLMEYFLIPAQRDEEIEFSLGSQRASGPVRGRKALPSWIEYIKFRIKHTPTHLAKLARVSERLVKKIMWPNLHKATDAKSAIPENHKEDHLANLQVEGPNTLKEVGGWNRVTRLTDGKEL